MPVEQQSDKAWFTKTYNIPLEDAMEFAKLPSTFGAHWRQVLESINEQLPEITQPRPTRKELRRLKKKQAPR